MKAFGGVMLAIGVLIAGLSGLCCMMFLNDASFRSGDGWQVVALFGGFPFVMGIMLVLLGLHLLRKDGPI